MHLDLKHLSRNQKIMLGVGAVVVIYLIYRWQMSSGSSVTGSNTGTGTTTTGTTDPNATDTSASDYAALAGQEQSDVAALQDQNEQLQAEFDSFSGGLGTADTSGLTGVDASGLSASGGGMTAGSGTVAASSPVGGTTQSAIPSIATGTTSVNRTTVSQSTIATNVGGPFYNYYRRVTGKAPPARVQTSNWIYQAWKAGVRAASIAQSGFRARGDQLIGSQLLHASTTSTRVAHPNPTHAPMANVTRKLPAARPQPPAHRPAAPARRK